MAKLIASGAVAVITGAANGIGAAAARHFANLGMKLVLFDQDEARLRSVAETLKGDICAQAGDVSKMADVEAPA
jgi:NADP-dependent 3-hydroxy acid dehydrogenase YdfG